MGRSKKVNNDGSSAYSVVQMPGIQMDLHKKQQSLIFNELNASRQKLAEENQMLRDELAEAKMIIRLLKMKLDEREAKEIKTSAVNSKDSTVKQGIPANFMKAVERSKKKRYLFKQKAPSRREAFLNPRPPGSKAFSPRRSLSPPQATRRISPRSSFSPILGNNQAQHAKGESGSSFSDSQVQSVTNKLAKATLKN